MLYSNQFEMFFFDDLNISEFLKKYQNLCFDYDLEENEMIRRFSKYCDVLNEQYVKTIVVINVSEGKKLMKILSKKYKNKDIEQQIYFINYLKIFKNKKKIDFENILQYCRQYSTIFKKFIDMKRFQLTLKSTGFLQEFSKSFAEEVIVKYNFDENDDNFMNFDLLIFQILQMSRFKITFRQTRRTDYKIDKIFQLIDEMKFFLTQKRINDNVKNLLKTNRKRNEYELSANAGFDEMTKIMKNMILNVNNLMNCVLVTQKIFIYLALSFNEAFYYQSKTEFIQQIQQIQQI